MEFSEKFNPHCGKRLPILAATVQSVEELHDYTAFLPDCTDFKPKITYELVIQPDGLDFPCFFIFHTTQNLRLHVFLS